MHVCLAGVYQEIMGSIHNMFGSLNTVVVRAGEAQPVTGGWVVDWRSHLWLQYCLTCLSCLCCACPPSSSMLF